MKLFELVELGRADYDVLAVWLSCREFTSSCEEQTEMQALIAGRSGIILVDQLLSYGNGEYRFIAYPLEDGKIDLRRGQPVKPSRAIKEICAKIYASNIERCRYGMLSTAEVAMLKAGIPF